MLRYVRLATEAMSSQSEQEVEILARISNPDGMAQAFAIEKQIQAQIRTKLGAIRVRKTTTFAESGEENDDAKYVLTTKFKENVDGIKSNTETDVDINEDIFKQFLSVAETYMNKTRYKFRVEKLEVTVGETVHQLDTKDLIFEVDTFVKADGSMSHYCKIDLEVQSLKEQFVQLGITASDLKYSLKVGALPFKPIDFVLNDGSDDPEKKALISKIYDNEFMINRVK
jgi:hypothetical protein